MLEIFSIGLKRNFAFRSMPPNCKRLRAPPRQQRAQTSARKEGWVSGQGDRIRVCLFQTLIGRKPTKRGGGEGRGAPRHRFAAAPSDRGGWVRGKETGSGSACSRRKPRRIMGFAGFWATLLWRRKGHLKVGHHAARHHTVNLGGEALTGLGVIV